MIYIFVEKKIEKKLKKIYYEVYQITQYTDVLGKPTRIKQLAGPVTIKQLEEEIKGHQEQIDYRNQILTAIKDIEDRKAMHTDLNKVLAEMDKQPIA